MNRNCPRWGIFHRPHTKSRDFLLPPNHDNVVLFCDKKKVNIVCVCCKCSQLIKYYLYKFGMRRRCVYNNSSTNRTHTQCFIVLHFIMRDCALQSINKMYYVGIYLSSPECVRLWSAHAATPGTCGITIRTITFLHTHTYRMREEHHRPMRIEWMKFERLGAAAAVVVECAGVSSSQWIIFWTKMVVWWWRQVFV